MFVPDLRPAVLQHDNMRHTFVYLCDEISQPRECRAIIELLIFMQYSYDNNKHETQYFIFMVLRQHDSLTHNEVSVTYYYVSSC